MGTVRPATTSVQQQSVTSCNNNINNTNNIMLQFALGLALLSVVSGQDDPLASLAQNIPGVPGEDYPIFVTPPDTGFDCDEQIEGYYSDQDADCQAFHICGNDGSGSLIKYSFLCPNGESPLSLLLVHMITVFTLQGLCSTSSTSSVIGGST